MDFDIFSDKLSFSELFLYKNQYLFKIKFNLINIIYRLRIFVIDNKIFETYRF